MERESDRDKDRDKAMAAGRGGASMCAVKRAATV